MDDTSQTSRVLLVEDEPLIPEITSEVIEEAGFEVVTAENAAAAIQVLTQTPHFAIVFSDLYMPGSINGLGLAEYVRRRWPSTKVVLTSRSAS